MSFVPTTSNSQTQASDNRYKRIYLFLILFSRRTQKKNCNRFCSATPRKWAYIGGCSPDFPHHHRHRKSTPSSCVFWAKNNNVFVFNFAWLAPMNIQRWSYRFNCMEIILVLLQVNKMLDCELLICCPKIDLFTQFIFLFNRWIER